MKVISRRKRDDEQRSGTMTVVEHLEELRHRIIICLCAVAAGSLFGWLLYPHFMDLIRSPFCDYINANPSLAPPTKCDLVYSGPLDGMLVKIKVVVFLGLGIALPVVLYQIWGFVAPGLTAKEKRYSIPFVASSCALFFLGAAVAYLMLPKGLGFLLGFRRYSLLGISIFAAVITPSSDPYTMLAMMIPMYLFYEASIIIGRFLKRQPRTA